MMWLGGTNGLIGYNAHHGFMPDEKDYIAWFRQTSTNHYMSHNRVRRVYADRDGNVIVCTDHGLNIYNPLTRQMRNIIVTDHTQHYSTAWAYDIVDDGMGRYWICSYMGGVFVINKENYSTPQHPLLWPTDIYSRSCKACTCGNSLLTTLARYGQECTTADSTASIHAPCTWNMS